MFSKFEHSCTLIVFLKSCSPTTQNILWGSSVCREDFKVGELGSTPAFTQVFPGGSSALGVTAKTDSVRR